MDKKTLRLILKLNHAVRHLASINESTPPEEAAERRQVVLNMVSEVEHKVQKEYNHLNGDPFWAVE
jgi:hypothetical protein